MTSTGGTGAAVTAGAQGNSSTADSTGISNGNGLGTTGSGLGYGGPEGSQPSGNGTAGNSVNGGATRPGDGASNSRTNVSAGGDGPPAATSQGGGSGNAGAASGADGQSSSNGAAGGQGQGPAGSGSPENGRGSDITADDGRANETAEAVGGGSSGGASAPGDGTSGSSGAGAGGQGTDQSLAGTAACGQDGVSAPNASGGCGSRLVPVEFSASRDGSYTGMARAVMCAEPAAYNAGTGALSMSLCWRGIDLPPQLLAEATAAADGSGGSGKATAAAPAALRVAVPLLDRYTGNVTSLAPGNYSLAVDGVGSFGAVVRSAAGDTSVGPYPAGTPGAVMVPAGGVSALTLWFEVSLSGAGTGSNATAKQGVANGSDVGLRRRRIVTIAFARPPSPSPPAALTCKCAPVMDTSSMGGCPDGLAPLTTTSLAPASSETDPGTFSQCAPPPSYDAVARSLTFSACWRHGCLPDALARGPYELLFGPVSSPAAAMPPAGVYRLRASVPAGVDMSLEWLPVSDAATEGSWQSVAAATGKAASQVVVPAGGVAQMRVRVRVASDGLGVDGAAGSLELKLLRLTPPDSSNRNVTATGNGNADGNSGSASGSIPGSSLVLETPDGVAVTPPVLDAAAVANATLTAITELWVSRRIGASGGGNGSGSGGGGSEGNNWSRVTDLEELLRRSMVGSDGGGGGGQAKANVSVSVSVTGYRLSLPLGFRDFAAVPDCGPESLAALEPAVSRALAQAATDPAAYDASGAAAATLMGVGCSYGTLAFGASGRRRGLQQTCNAVIATPIYVDTQPLALDAYLLAATSALSAGVGAGSACPLDASSPDLGVVSKLAVTVTAPSALLTAAAVAGGAVDAAAASAAACTSAPQLLATSLGLADGEAQLVGCELTVAQPATELPSMTPAGGGTTSGPQAEPSSGNGGGVSMALVAGLVVGGVLMVAAAMAAALIAARRRRHSADQHHAAGTLDDTRALKDHSSSLIGVVNPSANSSDDSDRFAIAAAVAAAAETKSKRRRRSTGGSIASFFAADDAVPIRNAASCKTPRSSNGKISRRASAFGSESIFGVGSGGIEEAFMSVVPAATDDGTGFPSPAIGLDRCASGATSDTSHRHSRRSCGRQRDSHSHSRCSASGAGGMRWGRFSHPGCPLDANEDPELERPLTTRCSRHTPGVRFSDCGSGGGGDGNASGKAAENSGWYDFFGLDDELEGAAEVVAGVMAALPASGAANRLAARRSSNGGGGRRRSSNGGEALRYRRRRTRSVLRRCDGGSLLFAPRPSADGSGSDDGSGSSTSASASPASPSSPLPERNTAASSSSAAARRAALRPPPLAFVLPGGDAPTGEPPLQRGYAAAVAGAAGAATAAACLASAAGLVGEDRDLLRVQSRRPGFVDRTGGSLAAAVVHKLAAPLADVRGPDEGLIAGSVRRRSAGDGSGFRLHPPDMPAAVGGFFRRNSIAPFLGARSPMFAGDPSALPHRAASAAASTGGADWMALDGGLSAWSAPNTAANSPSGAPISVKGLWAGVMGRRRSGGDTAPEHVGPEALRKRAQTPYYADHRRVTAGGLLTGAAPGRAEPLPPSAAVSKLAADDVGRYAIRRAAEVLTSGALDPDGGEEAQEDGEQQAANAEAGPCPTAQGAQPERLLPAPPMLGPMSGRSPRKLPPLTSHAVAAGARGAAAALDGGMAVPPASPARPSAPDDTGVNPMTVRPAASATAAHTGNAGKGTGEDGNAQPAFPNSSESMGAGPEELCPAFPPSPAMRARQLYAREASVASSAGSVGSGASGGLVDRELDRAAAAGGAARLALLRRLEMGPPRPAWGLVDAGVGPMKRSIASVQYAPSLNNQTAASAAVAALVAAGGAALPSGVAAGAGRSAGGVDGRSPRGAPARLLSRTSRGGRSPASASQPFVQLPGEERTGGYGAV